MRKTRTTIVLGLVIAAVGVPAAHAARSSPTWRQALAIRSTALNREYHLGRFAVPASAATTAKPAWLKALEDRGQAMNEHYRLGAYSTPRRGISARTWGVLAALLAVLIAAGVFVGRTTRRTTSRIPESA